MAWFLLSAIIIGGVLLMDHFGLAGREKRPVTVGRAIGATLMLLGVALILGLL
jgi:uncharacterized membrane protein YdcZ (DUF606 family)